MHWFLFPQPNWTFYISTYSRGPWVHEFISLAFVVVDDSIQENWYWLLKFYAHMLWYVQMTRPVFCRPSRSWSIDLQTLLSQTSGCWMSCWGWRCWVADSMPKFAVRERCMNETTPCWICWHQKTSAASFWQPCSELVNNMSSTSSHKTEVRNTMMS